MARQDAIDKRRVSLKEGFMLCEWCGSTKTPENAKVCIRCKGPMKEQREILAK